jgi:hypothetical protein
VSEPVVVQDAGEVEDAGEPAGTGVRADVLWVLGTYVVLGVVGGLLWWLLTEPAYFTKGDSGGLGMGEVQLARRFSADGWFAVIAAVLGLLSGGALTWWRSRDHLLTAVLLVVGSCLASALMAVLGWLLGPSAPDTVAASAAVGDRIATQLEVTADVCYLVWPIAVLGGALLVLWSPPADTPGSWGRNRS